MSEMMHGSNHLINLPKVYAALEHVLDTIRIAGVRDCEMVWNVDRFGLQVTQVLTLTFWSYPCQR